MKSIGLTLEEIQSFSDEVRLLTSAGLPLESNLKDAGQGHGVRLKKLMENISDGLSQGQSLHEVIQRETHGESRMLSAAIAAGIRSNSLAMTVEMMGDFADDLIELRRSILQAMTYPLMILMIGWGLFVLVMNQALVHILEAIQQLEISVPDNLLTLLQWNRDYPEWTLVAPAIAVVFVGFWLASGRASAMAFRGPERILLLIPGVRSLIRDLQFYTLSRMLSLLVEKQLPLDESLELAGASCGAAHLDSACHKAAEAVRLGHISGVTPGSSWRKGRMPPLLQACLHHASGDADRFLLRLNSVTQFYLNRLSFNAAWLRTTMPSVALVLIAGGTLLAYSLMLFWPLTEIYNNLGYLGDRSVTELNR
jgi:type II secretory pathway component PulF